MYERIKFVVVAVNVRVFVVGGVSSHGWKKFLDEGAAGMNVRA